MTTVRAVSLLPSATEFIHALGLGDQQVGRSAECDHPIEARRLPVVMRSRWDFSRAPPAEIDQKVRESRGRGEDLYVVDEEVLTRLHPDLIFTQDLCTVCSVTPSSLQAVLARVPFRPRLVSLSHTRLDQVVEQAVTIAEALERGDRGASLRASLQRRLEACRPGSPGKARTRVLVLEWLDPPIVAGLWVPEMVRMAGGSPLLSAPGVPGAAYSWEEIRGTSADLILVSPCGFPLERTLREANGPATPLGDLHPPRGVWAVDEAFFSRPGPRLVEGTELLSDLLHGTGRPRRSFESRAVPLFRRGVPLLGRPVRR